MSSSAAFGYLSDSTPAAELRRHGADADEGQWWMEIGMSVASTFKLDDVAENWRALERTGVDSLTQSLDLTQAWIRQFNVPETDQLYVCGSAKGEIAAIFPLIRRKRYGFDIWTWMPGPHVGSNEPVMNRELLIDIGEQGRADLWQRMFSTVFGADAVVLHSMPTDPEMDLYADLGQSIDWDVLYRSEFSSWEECRKVQHTRSRRKHDRQQGAKLEAMGDVSFEVVDGRADPALLDELVGLMFAQKAKRFAEWGVEDPFVDADVRAFYRNVIAGDGSLSGQMHVLRLDGKVVAMRYNLTHGDRIFAMISSMDDDPDLSPGSPGKQNLLRSMEHIFSLGFKVCDQGAGYSDEKRHWCNVQIPLRTHYLPISTKGAVGIKGHQFKGYLKREIKQNKQLFALAKSVRSVIKPGG